MSSYDDEPIEFDFFDEPETVEATQRRRLPRLERPGGRGGGGEKPPRPPMRAPTGLVPLARLVGLIAIAIAIVLGLVFWVGSCQGKSKQDEYKAYADKVAAIAAVDRTTAKDFSTTLLQPGLKQTDLVDTLQSYANQEQQAFTQAQQIHPPGPLRAYHQNLVNAIELRYKGFASLGDTLAASGALKNTTDTTTKLTSDGQLLTASDVVWQQLYTLPATERLQEQGVKGVVIPTSVLVDNADLLSARSFTLLLQRLGGASTGGTPSGKHGDGIIGTRVTPQGLNLDPANANTVKVTSDLAFSVTVENSGDFQELNVVVTLTIDFGAGKPIVKRDTIDAIASGAQHTVTFTGFNNIPATAFGNKSTVTALVKAVPGETNTSNNKSTYSVFFTLP
jgi:hypothetical protein